MLGVDDGKKFSEKDARAKVVEISEKYGFLIDPDKKIYQMSVSEKQTVEIVKVLYRGADILILDEPTAVLTPQESDRLFAVLRKMREDGKSIVIITHKMHEVLALSDRVSILRKGEYVGTVQTSETTEAELTELMVGKKVALNIDRAMPHDCVDRLKVEHVSLTNMEGVQVLSDISFTARGGEILASAGIAGSGQRELLEAIAGLQHLSEGTITYRNPKTDEDVNLRDKTPTQIKELGVRLSFVPEDRLGMGLVGNMDLVTTCAPQLPEGKVGVSQPQKAQVFSRGNRGEPGSGYSRNQHPGAQTFGRKCAEGSGGQRDRAFPHCSDGGIPGERSGHQLLLHDL